MSETRFSAVCWNISSFPAFNNRKAWVGLPFLAMLFLATTLNVPALDPAEKPSDYIVAHWGTDEGLPHNQVRCIFQTRDGYLWIGTQQGLARFDGLTFTPFSQHDTPVLPDNLITSFAETSDGSLWIGTSGGLARYQNGRFTEYGLADGLKAQTVNDLCVAPDGSLWIGGRAGITRWKDEKFINDIDTSAYDVLGLRYIGVDRNKAVWIAAGFDGLRYKDGKFKHYGREGGVRPPTMRMLFVEGGGNIVCGNAGGGPWLTGGHFYPPRM